MKKLLLAAIALALLSWLPGCEKPARLPPGNPAAAQSAVPADLMFVLAAEAVDAANLGPPPHPKPKPMPHPKPIGFQPKGYKAPYAGHPYVGGKHGPYAKHWVGYHHHGKHYLYGLYRPAWRGYTYRVWNGRWLYWSPLDYCWYRYDAVLGVFIPLNPDGTDAISPAAPLPPPPPPPPAPPSPPPGS